MKLLAWSAVCILAYLARHLSLPNNLYPIMYYLIFELFERRLLSISFLTAAAVVAAAEVVVVAAAGEKSDDAGVTRPITFGLKNKVLQR